MVHQSEIESEFQPMAERRRAESPKKIKRDSDDQADNSIMKFPFAGDEMRSVKSMHCDYLDFLTPSIIWYEGIRKPSVHAFALSQTR
jgi:hypothetical protein